MGWTHCTGFDPKGYALNQKLVIRLLDGTVKEFKPNPMGVFIESWAFATSSTPPLGFLLT